MESGSHALEVLDEDESLALLGSADVGRVGVVVHGQPLIFPVSHVLEGRSIIVRTESGRMLSGASLAVAPHRRPDHQRPALRRRGRKSMTNVLIPVAGDAGATAEDATPGCGCCVPPPDAAQAEGRRRALAELQARRDALERRLQRLG